MRFELSRIEALKLMSDMGEDYKVELINELPEDSIISFYKQGDFVDLVREEVVGNKTCCGRFAR